ncbi:hypothetical protein D9613_006469 [Agrocybe pediades]|uniref:Uncharacterized protein n=1 Tax=Agrocybe pediades TaxID=84607 RepID=A0A8H4VIG4_9AGAR|nr:hypothetical protein D9613_006469 [Agrocybe pediades]
MVMDEIGEDLRTILRCRLVNSTFAAVAIPFAFKTIVIKKMFIKEASDVTFEKLSARKDITKHVKRIVYDTEGVVIPYAFEQLENQQRVPRILSFPPHSGKHNELLRDEQVVEFIAVMVEELNALHRFKNLKSLSIHLPWLRWEYEGYYAYENEPYTPAFFSNVDTRLQSAILEALSSVYVKHTFPFQLNTFELGNVLPYPTEALISEGMQSMIKHITSLYVSVYPLHLYPEEAEREERSKGSIYTRFAHTIAALMRPLENLESLKYCDDQGHEQAIDKRWEL